MRPLELIPDWVANNPTRHDGGSWLGFTGALLFHACGMQTSWLDVNSARMRSTIIGHDPKTAPSGAFHWWQYHAGQAALDIDGGGTRLLTATMAPNEWVAPGVGYGENGEGFVRIAMVENEQRLRQAARNVKRYLQSMGVNTPARTG